MLRHLKDTDDHWTLCCVSLSDCWDTVYSYPHRLMMEDHPDYRGMRTTYCPTCVAVYRLCYA